MVEGSWLFHLENCFCKPQPKWGRSLLFEGFARGRLNSTAWYKHASKVIKKIEPDIAFNQILPSHANGLSTMSSH